MGLKSRSPIVAERVHPVDPQTVDCFTELNDPTISNCDRDRAMPHLFLHINGGSRLARAINWRRGDAVDHEIGFLEP